MGEESACSQAKMRTQTWDPGGKASSKEAGQGDWHCKLAQLEVEGEGHEVELGGWIS